MLNSVIGTDLGISPSSVLFSTFWRTTMTDPSRPKSARADSFARNEIAAEPPLSARISTLPSKTCARLMPDFSTSTPNSVPRSVIVAVGVRTVKEGRGEEGDS